MRSRFDTWDSSSAGLRSARLGAAQSLPDRQTLTRSWRDHRPILIPWGTCARTGFVQLLGTSNRHDTWRCGPITHSCSRPPPFMHSRSASRVRVATPSQGLLLHYFLATLASDTLRTHPLW